VNLEAKAESVGDAVVRVPPGRTAVVRAFIV